MQPSTGVRTIRAMPPVPAPRREILGLSPSGFVSLAAVLALLVVVSLPRLRGLALRENEVDARGTVQLLARALASLPPGERDVDLEQVAQRTRLVRALHDAEWLEDGRVLRLHGYLFELCAAPAPLQAAGLALSLARTAPEPSAALAVRAWPWSAGTGRAAFLAHSGALFLHTNEDGRWQGLTHRPALGPEPLEDWRLLP